MSTPAGAEAGATPDTGTIHDIGYRRYDGPRLGPVAAGRALFGHSLRGAYGLGRSTRSKVVPLLVAAVMVVPALIVAAVAIVIGSDELPVEYSSYVVNLQLVVTVFVAAQAPQSVSRDLRFRVVALYFSRPLSRTAYVRVKLLAMAAALFVLIASPVLVLYAGALLAEMPFWANTREAAAALVGAAFFAVVLAAFGLVVAAFTPRRGIGVAAVVAVLVVLGAVGAVVQNIAVEEGNATAAGWAGLISPFSLVDGVQVWALGAESSVAVPPPDGFGGPVFAAVALLLVGLCYLLLLLRYRRVSVS